jgi:hypothetical protein
MNYFILLVETKQGYKNPSCYQNEKKKEEATENNALPGVNYLHVTLFTPPPQ